MGVAKHQTDRPKGGRIAASKLQLNSSEHFDAEDNAELLSAKHNEEISSSICTGSNSLDTTAMNPTINILTLSDGQTFNMRSRHFELVREVGHGSFGHVKKMRHLKSNIFVAVKIMKVTLDPDELKAIKRDISTLERSRNMCTYLIDYYGVMARPNGEYWMVMELADLDLKHIIDKQLAIKVSESRRDSPPTIIYPILPEYITVRVIFCISEAMIFLKKELNILHRDIKPSNIVYFRSGNFKLCDFGISTTLINSLAKSMNVGTINYNAPEKIESTNEPYSPNAGEGYNDRSDVWSLGLVAYEMLKGQTPWKNVEFTNFSVMCYILDVYEKIDDLDKLNISPALRQFISRATEKNMEKRLSLMEIKKQAIIQQYSPDSEEIAAVVKFIENLF